MAAWTYDDWVLSSSYPVGSTARLQRLELHIQEVSRKLSSGNFSEKDKSHEYDVVERYLKGLKEDLATVQAETSATSGDGTTFVRAVPIRPGESGP